MEVVEACQIPEVYMWIYFPDAIGEVLSEDVMYFHLGIGLLVAAAVLPRNALTVKPVFLPSYVQEVISI